MTEQRGRKRKQSSENHLEQELELLKAKYRLLEEQEKSEAAKAGTEGNNNRDPVSDARASDRSNLDEGYTSSGAANPPIPPLETAVKLFNENESHHQRNALYAPLIHAKDSKVVKTNNSPPSSPEGYKDNILRINPPSPGPSHSNFTCQTVNMQSHNVPKTESSVTLVNNIQQVSIAQNLLYIPPSLPNNMRFKKRSSIPSASSEPKEGNILPNKRPSSPPTNNILPQMAERLCSVLQNGLPKEERYRLQEKYKIPSNCTLMKAPCLNPEVIPFMDEVAKKRDSAMLKYQDQLGAGMVAIAEGVTLASRSGGDSDLRTAMEHINRGLHLLADLHSDQSRLRRIKCTPVDSWLKSFLVAKLSHRHHHFQDINHLFKRDDTVFGRDIGNMIKEFLRKE